MRRVLTVACVGCVWIGAVEAEAAVIAFEGFGATTLFGDENVGNGLAVATSDGFNFVSSGDHFHIGSAPGGAPSNGTGVLLQDRSYSITMSKVGGGVFSLLSADLGEDISSGAGASAMSVIVTGFFSGGGSIVQEVALDGDVTSFQNELFVGFTNLTSVVFRGVGFGGPGANGFSLDNIEVAEGVVAVAEPGTLALLGLGLVGIAASHRRKQ
jgi:hypothetical protein